jgi:hypothetical protein
MPLGASLWTTSESFYNRLTLAQHGDITEQDFAHRRGLVRLFPHYAEFWKRHVCPATTRPHGFDFRPGVSEIVCQIARTSYSILVALMDAEDSLAKVQAGDRGVRNRNCREVFVSAGNALQLLTKLQFAASGGNNPRSPNPASLAGQLGIIIDPFPDWNSHWKPDRDEASTIRHYLTHEGLFYTFHNPATDETLVLEPAMMPGTTWKQAEASYSTNPGDWRSIVAVCKQVFHDTAAFIDLLYERLLSTMDKLLTNASYQRLWGWDNTTPPATMHAPSLGPSVAMGIVSVQHSSASATVPGPHKMSISSGPCIP